MKKTITSISAVSLFGVSLIFASNALAVVNPNLIIRERENVIINNTVNVTITPTPTVKITLPALKRVQIKVALKKTNALKEIERRIDGLNKLAVKVNGIKRISAEQKTTIIAQINIEISKLGELKTKIEAETDATALQELKKSITQSYRIFGLFMPRIEIIAHADKIIAIADAMSEKTSEAGLLKIVSDSKVKAQSAINLVLPLVPEEFPGNKTTLSEARNLLREARTNLNTVFPSLKGE